MPIKPKTRTEDRPKPKPWRHQTSARERGYTWDWEQFSRNYRAQQPLCEACLDGGTITPAESVHHIEPITEAPERKLDRTNVIALCKACHISADNDANANNRCRRIAQARCAE